jgi:carboxymethylenebutenolidase
VLGWIVGVLALLVLLIALSAPIDGAIGSGRVAAVTNTAITADDGAIVRAYVALPEGDGPHPAVIMIHEWWGLNESIVGMADELAAAGYVVVAPDTFRGSSTSWIPRAIYQVVTTAPAQANNDLDAVHAWLAARPDVQADRIAIIGFCYGGRASLNYSLHNPQGIAATITLYGMIDSDPAALGTLQGPVLGIFGGADTSIPIADVRALESNLAQAGVAHRISIYPDQPHAFVSDVAAIRAGGAAGDAWAEVLAFLGGALGAGDAAPQSAPAAWPAHDAATFAGQIHHWLVCRLTPA